MASTIENFASFLGLMYCVDGRFDLDTAAFDQPESIEDIYKSIDNVQNLYKQEFESVVSKILEIDEEEFFELFVKAILSRSVSLSENPSYFHFMLVCTLIREVVYESFYIYRCYMFAEIGSQCLKATYERCYKAKFSNTTDFYAELLSYCRNFLLEGCDGKKLLQETYRQDISTLIESLKDIDDVNFQLTDIEKKRLAEAIEGVISEDYIRTKNKSFESEHAEEDNSETDNSETDEDDESLSDCSCDIEKCNVCNGECMIIIFKLAKCRSCV